MSAVERALAALRRVERAETGCRPAGRPAAPAAPGGCPGGSRPGSAPARSPWPGWCAASSRVLHMAVALEQVDDREVGRGLAIRHRGALQHPPALRAVGVDALVDQARLAHAGLAHQGDHLAMARAAPAPGPAAGPPAPAAAPQSGVRPRATAACKRRRSALAPTSSKTSTGSASPLTGTGPRALTCTNPSTSRRVAARQADGPRRGRAAPCAPPGASSARRPSSPCAGRCQSPAPPLPRS